MNTEQKATEAFFLQIKPYLTAGADVLDVGSDTGRIARMIAPEVRSVLLSDPDSNALNTAKELCRQADIKNADFINLDFLSIHSRHSFDIILFFLSLHHIKDMESTFQHCCSLIRNKGLLIIGEFYQENQMHPFHVYNSVPHNGFSVKELNSLSTSYGFKTIKVSRFDTLIKNETRYPLFALIAGAEML